MSKDIEVAECSFCKEIKPVSRKYIFSKHKKNTTDPIIIYYCQDCGIEDPFKDHFVKPSIGSSRFTAGDTLDM